MGDVQQRKDFFRVLRSQAWCVCLAHITSKIDLFLLIRGSQNLVYWPSNTCLHGGKQVSFLHIYACTHEMTRQNLLRIDHQVYGGGSFSQCCHNAGEECPHVATSSNLKDLVVCFRLLCKGLRVMQNNIVSIRSLNALDVTHGIPDPQAERTYYAPDDVTLRGQQGGRSKFVN